MSSVGRTERGVLNAYIYLDRKRRKLNRKFKEQAELLVALSTEYLFVYFHV